MRQTAVFEDVKDEDVTLSNVMIQLTFELTEQFAVMNPSRNHKPKWE